MPTDKVYYQPASQGYEEVIRKRMEHWDHLRREARTAQTPAASAEAGTEAKTDGKGQG